MSRPVFMRFGKYKGENILDVPLDYLQWMVKQETLQHEEAQAEVYRRETGGPDPRSIAASNSDEVPPPSIEIKAIDAASMLLQDLWKDHPYGVATWLLDFWHEALEQGEVTKLNLDTVIIHQNVIFFYNTYNIGYTLTDIKPTQDYYL